MNFFKKFLNTENIKSKNDYSDYLDLDKFEREIDTDSLDKNIKKYVKIVVFSNQSQIQLLKQEIYNGNILLVDISIIKSIDNLRKQFLTELKEVTDEINGDIVGIKDNLVLITPTSIKIDRKKIGGHY